MYTLSCAAFVGQEKYFPDWSGWEVFPLDFWTGLVWLGRFFMVVVYPRHLPPLVVAYIYMNWKIIYMNWKIIYIQEPIIIISIFICSPCGSRHFFFWLKNFYPRAFETDSHFPWGTLKEKTHFLPQPNKNSAFPLSQCEGPNWPA